MVILLPYRYINKINYYLENSNFDEKIELLIIDFK